MRFSKSTRRGLTKTGWVCESTNPGRTIFPAQSISQTLLPILFQPGIAQRILSGADGNDLSAEAQDGSVFDDAKFFQVGAAARARFPACGLQSEKLAAY